VGFVKGSLLKKSPGGLSSFFLGNGFPFLSVKFIGDGRFHKPLGSFFRGNFCLGSTQGPAGILGRAGGFFLESQILLGGFIPIC
jgi:hypothetical protein